MSVHQTLPNLVSEFNLDELETARTPKDLIIVNLLHINTSIKKTNIQRTMNIIVLSVFNTLITSSTGFAVTLR